MKAKGTELIFVNEMTNKTETGFKPLSRSEKEYLEQTESEFELKNFEDSKKVFIASIYWHCSGNWLRSFIVFIR